MVGDPEGWGCEVARRKGCTALRKGADVVLAGASSRTFLAGDPAGWGCGVARRKGCTALRRGADDVLRPARREEPASSADRTVPAAGAGPAPFFDLGLAGGAAIMRASRPTWTEGTWRTWSGVPVRAPFVGNPGAPDAATAALHGALPFSEGAGPVAALRVALSALSGVLLKAWLLGPLLNVPAWLTLAAESLQMGPAGGAAGEAEGAWVE